MFENLDGVPNSADSFLWADFAELRAVLHPDKAFSRGDLASIATRSTDIGRTMEGENAEDAEDIEAEPLRKPKFNYESKWKDIIDFIETRSNRIGAAYPFEVSEDRDTIQLVADRSTWGRRTYLALLLAASLRHIKRTRHHELTRAFEETCLAVFEKLMPIGAEIRATWAAGGAEAPYRGTLYQKMLLVANDLRVKPNFEEDDFKANDTGDGGIDLLAWHPMSDEQPGIPIAFAQCGCSRDDWRFKQLEASPAKHYSHLPVQHPWATYYFMPLDLRKSNGRWAYASDIGQAIIVDRLRLIRLMEQYNLAANAPAPQILDDALAAAIA
ncbi:hypothetical protein EIP75_22905 [Aquabacterium soli]|uniref:Uncharacterized protein n=1 Tax=Aquabacterium soli TaxID=2493092 RepID=A0A426UZM7_9BURK|nr:hypothetical protein [Aquabacterium soli]RRS00055.1 hypothetical protein EIP75_22905 [Aquabacterium soli]